MSTLDSRTEDKLTLSALKFICGDAKQVCRLCLHFTESEISLEKLVEIQAPYYNEHSTSYQFMLNELNVPAESLLPNILCESCAEITINSYLFLKLRQFAYEKWDNVVNIFNQCLAKADSIEPVSKTAYVIINKNDNLILESMNKCSVKSNKVDVMKDIKSCCRSYVRQEMKQYICNICDKKFICQYFLKKHRRSHSYIPHPCPRCMKIFMNSFQVKDHIKRVHLSKTIYCPECPKKFATQALLHNHKLLYHNPAMCKICKIYFPSRMELKVHLNKHGAGTCQTCNKKFTSQHTFKLHLKHCGKVGYKQTRCICDICSKSYSCKSSLISHLGIAHGFAKNFLSCKWCKKKFNAMSRLKCHILTHTREKNFYCEHCGLKFVSQPALTYHIRLHTGERPYACDQCDETFLSASRRVAHKKRKHIGPTNECSLCYKKFHTKYEVRLHLKRHFNIASKLFITDTDHYFPKYHVNYYYV